MTKARDIADFKFEDIVDTGTEGTKVASGTTAQRGSTAGQIRFNSDLGLAEYYTGTAFKAIDAPPVVSSVSPSVLGESVLGSSQTIIITGSNFSDTVTVTIIGNDGTEYSPVTTTRDSDTQVTITTPTNLTKANDTYKIRVQNSSGLSNVLANALAINATPVFSTASGSLGTLVDSDRASSNLTSIIFTDADDTPTVSVTSGSLPSGITLNSNGTFSGTANSVASDTTSNFTVTATDGSETATRDYSITVASPIVADFLVIAGGGGAGYNQGGGGGAGGYRTSYGTSGANSSAETALTFVTGTTYTITVGAGGSISANGGNSSISGSGITTITSTGGGGGGDGAANNTAQNGGSGGGAGHDSQSNRTFGSGTANQGFAGGTNNPNAPNYVPGGGGGASETGNTDGQGHGGDGLASTITGSSVVRGGGGSSGTRGGTPPTAGNGGGGQGVSSGVGGNGTANTGGGGGGGAYPAGGGTGGSGVVILRMPTAKYSGTTTGSPTVGTDGTDTILTFNSSGSYTA